MVELLELPYKVPVPPNAPGVGYLTGMPPFWNSSIPAACRLSELVGLDVNAWTTDSAGCA